MNERTDSKLREVVVGRYTYRHEAEFAAGFLDDAGIWHRLQIDDPSLGMTLTSATLLVRALDEAEAREVLEGDPLAPRTPVRGSGSSDGVRRDRSALELRRTEPPVRGRGEPPMGGRARILSLALAGGLFAAVVFGLPSAALEPWTTALGVGFGVFGLVGRAPGPLRRALNALVGDLP